MASRTLFPTEKTTHLWSLGRCIRMLLGSMISLLLVFSCASGAESGGPTPEEQMRIARNEMDSLASLIGNIDSLKKLTRQYAEEKNDFAEMVYRKALGREYQDHSCYQDATEEHKRSLVLAERVNDTLQIIESLNLLGDSYRYLGVIGLASEYYYRALELADDLDAIDDQKFQRNKMESLNGIGSTQMMLSNFGRADKLFRIALSVDRDSVLFDIRAVIYTNIGMVKEAEGQPDSAFYYYERAAEMYKNTSSLSGTARCYNRFGHLAEDRGDWEDALRFYHRSYYIMQQREGQGNTMESSLLLGRVYLRMKNMKEAHRYISEGMKYAVLTRSWRMLALASLLQSEYEEQTGNAASALEWYKKSRAYSDSVTNGKTRTFIHKLREDFLRERNDNEVEILRQNYAQERETTQVFIVWAVMVGFFALVCILFLLNTLRVRMRSQELMRHMEKVRSDFFTNITHEFRTPLTVMLGLGRKIADGQVCGDGKECCRVGTMIVRQGNSLLDLVNQLLEIAKTESAIGNADWRTGDIVPYVMMIVETCQEYAEQKGVSLTSEWGERELQMDFVPGYIQKVLQNLLANAVKYSGAGGKVMVRMGKLGKNQMVLSVSDTGKGIEKKDLPHIFDAFYTATNFGVEVSAGVGLALVRQAVGAMNGTITVRSARGKGTTFTVVLPLWQHGESYKAIEEDFYESAVGFVPPEQGGAAAELPEDDDADNTKPGVLIIEDNHDVATYMGMQLSCKHRVMYAASGEEGLAKAEKMMPDIIVTDVMMAGIDGYEVCRSIRKMESMCHTPIIVVSAKNSETDRLKGLEAGADAYLCKPFGAEELLLLVDNLVEQRRLFRKHCEEQQTQDKKEESGLKPRDREFINKFVDVVYARMSQGSLDIESLASVMCISSSQLRRKVFAITGEKVAAYVLKLKLKRALQLLSSQSDLSVAEVAWRCGFEDAAYFSRTFKNVYQMTPSQYRRQGSLGVGKN